MVPCLLPWIIGPNGLFEERPARAKWGWGRKIGSTGIGESFHMTAKKKIQICITGYSLVRLQSIQSVSFFEVMLKITQ